jgi:hypothetical protein
MAPGRHGGNCPDSASAALFPIARGPVMHFTPFRKNLMLTGPPILSRDPESAPGR